MLDPIGLLFAAVMWGANAGADACKKTVSARVHPAVALAFRSLLTCPLFVCAALAELQWDLSEVWQQVTRHDFVVALLVSGSINTGTSFLFLEGLRDGDLSNTLPYLALTPCLMLLADWALFGEQPGRQQMMGVLVVSAGGYALALVDTAGPKAAPLPRFHRSSALFVVIAALWAVSSPFDRSGAQASSPALYAACMSCTLGIMSCSFLAVHPDARARGRQLPWLQLVLYSGLSMAAYWSQLTCSLRLPVSCVAALKRTSILCSVLVGHLVFKEPLRRRLPAAAAMVMGTLCVIL
eukprot:TRINITY_DN51327_c0_g1_i1.p1 TRINITY_DN51327_c0_g1~~TRINITY_DN51327_c0_g1_i1.p1  ORF type:complete len:295 (+),score=86.06 TRINITY_DN51327_c0_g1_i1:92-976(+)